MVRQDGDLAEMIWGCDEIVAQLSRQFQLEAGDLIFTGTPAGVGALQPGDRVIGQIADLPPVAIVVSGAQS